MFSRFGIGSPARGWAAAQIIGCQGRVDFHRLDGIHLIPFGSPVARPDREGQLDALRHGSIVEQAGDLDVFALLLHEAVDQVSVPIHPNVEWATCLRRDGNHIVRAAFLALYARQGQGRVLPLREPESAAGLVRRVHRPLAGVFVTQHVAVAARPLNPRGPD